MSKAWSSGLLIALKKIVNPEKAQGLYDKYRDLFSAAYCDDQPPEMAAKDILHFEQLSADHPIQIDFYEVPEKSDKPLHLRLYQLNKSIPLSDILPIFEHM